MSKRYSASIIELEGESVLRLRDEQTDCTVDIAPGIGMNVIRYARGGRDIILPPPSLAQLRRWPTRFGIPVLSPPGRVSGGRFQYAGRSYQLPLTHGPHHVHGEIGRLPWELKRHGASAAEGAFAEAVYAYDRDPQRYAYFPHKLEYRLTYSVRDGDLYLQGSAFNGGECTVPLALGFHPYFVFSGGLKDVVLYAPPCAEWPRDGEGQAAGLPVPTGLTQRLEEGLPLGEMNSDLAFLRLENKESVWVIEDRPAARHLLLRTDPLFSNMVLFKPSWANAISLEPHSCVPDACNLPWDGEETGARGLDSGSARLFSWSIQVNER